MLKQKAGSRPQPVTLSPPRNRCSELSLLFHCVFASNFMPGPSLLFSHEHRRIRSQPQGELLSSVVTQISGKPGWAVDGAPSCPHQSLASARACLWPMKWGKTIKCGLVTLLPLVTHWSNSFQPVQGFCGTNKRNSNTQMLTAKKKWPQSHTVLLGRDSCSPGQCISPKWCSASQLCGKSCMKHVR